MSRYGVFVKAIEVLEREMAEFSPLTRSDMIIKIFGFDPADDGPEVDIIRRERQIAAGVALHWSDKDSHILCPPMTTDEASAKGIQL